MSEHDEQRLVVQWFRMQYPKYAKCLWAIPNGGKRHKGTAIKLKQEGVMAGVPDLFLMIPKAGWHGMFIEMKTKVGRLQETQKEFLGMATMLGYQGVVCFGFEDAKRQIREYLDN
jgi:hypothetical protein